MIFKQEEMNCPVNQAGKMWGGGLKATTGGRAPQEEGHGQQLSDQKHKAAEGNGMTAARGPEEVVVCPELHTHPDCLSRLRVKSPRDHGQTHRPSLWRHLELNTVNVMRRMPVDGKDFPARFPEQWLRKQNETSC